jgi:hypothetical protein
MPAFAGPEPMKKLSWGGHFDDPAAVHHHDAVGSASGESKLVRYDDHGHSVGSEGLDYRQHLADHFGIQR